MSQQKPHRSADERYKRKLFYDNGIKFVEVKGRLTGEYKPPTPVLRSSVNTTIQSSSGLIQQGTSHYSVTLQILFYSKEDYAEWLQYIGAEHKYYDEKGTIYVGIVNGEPDIKTLEAETKYLVTVNLLMIRKQDFEFRHQYPFIDIEGHWAKQYIDELQQRGLFIVYDHNGDPVQYFRPEVWINRAQTVALLTRAYKHIERILRGY